MSRGGRSVSTEEGTKVDAGLFGHLQFNGHGLDFLGNPAIE